LSRRAIRRELPTDLVTMVDRAGADAPTTALEHRLRAAASRGADGVGERLLTVKEVAFVLGLKPPWVYRHAEELGAIRVGRGDRAAIRFDAATVAERIAAMHVVDPAPTPRARRRAPSSGRSSGDAGVASLSIRPRVPGLRGT